MEMFMKCFNGRKINGDYFSIYKGKGSRHYYELDHFFDKINYNDYYIFKLTGKQRLATVEEFKEFKYAGYTFYKKDLYDLNHIQRWINFSGSLGGIQFLTKPVPPFSPEKIIIKK